MKPTVVLLLSDKRSGSTLFQEEICRHADIRTVDYSPHTYLETHHWLKAAVMLGLAPETFSGGRTYPGYGSAANARAYLIDCVRGNCPDFTPPKDDRELVFAGWEALCQKFAQPVFFEKSPQFLAHWSSLSLIAEWMQRTAFDVKVIGLTRNPLSVQYSAYKLFHTEPGRRQYGWLAIQRNLLAFRQMIPPEAFLHVRYEDIVGSPVEEFAKVCQFIGVSTNPDIGSKAHGKSMEKWKDDPAFRVRLDESVKQMARHFGYSDNELDNPEKPPLPLPVRMKTKLRGQARLWQAAVRNRLITPLKLRLRG